MVQKERDFLANPIFLCLLPPRGTVVTLAPLFSNIGVLSYRGALSLGFPPISLEVNDPRPPLFFLKRDFIYLFLERGREGERRKTPMCGCHLSASHWRPGPQPRHVQPGTLWLAVWCSTH